MTAGRRLAVVVGILGGMLLAAMALSLLVGSAGIVPAAVLGALLGRPDTEAVTRVVILDLRLPRILAAALAGGALAVAGVGFQALTRNPLAEPSVLGVSSGAAFGVVAGQLFGLGTGMLEALGLTAFAFAGAFVAGGLVYVIASGTGGLSVHTLLLAGVIVGIFFSSAVAVLISLVDTNRLGGIIQWLLGNVAPVPPAALAVFALTTLAGFVIVLADARRLNLLALGEDPARELGVDALALKRRIFAGAALLVAAVVAFAGPIGFVGLIVPHALRMLLGPDNRVLVPAAVLGGALFLLVADTLARNVAAPAELSVGVLTAFCGAPFFVYLLRAKGLRVLP
jgi:iron complex transport system permease protein